MCTCADTRARSCGGVCGTVLWARLQQGTMQGACSWCTGWGSNQSARSSSRLPPAAVWRGLSVRTPDAWLLCTPVCTSGMSPKPRSVCRAPVCSARRPAPCTPRAPTRPRRGRRELADDAARRCVAALLVDWQPIVHLPAHRTGHMRVAGASTNCQRQPSTTNNHCCNRTEERPQASSTPLPPTHTHARTHRLAPGQSHTSRTARSSGCGAATDLAFFTVLAHAGPAPPTPAQLPRASVLCCDARVWIGTRLAGLLQNGAAAGGTYHCDQTHRPSSPCRSRGHGAALAVQVRLAQRPRHGHRDRAPASGPAAHDAPWCASVVMVMVVEPGWRRVDRPP